MGVKKVSKLIAATLVRGKTNLSILFPALLSFLLLSCSTREAPSSPGSLREGSAQSSQESTPNSITSKGEPREQEWSKTINMARREGFVIVYSSGVLGAARDEIIKAFNQKYGVDVQYLLAGSGAFEERMDRERRVGIYSADIFMGGSTTFAGFLKPRGMLASLEPVLLLPEVLDEKLWHEEKLAYLDRERLILAFGINLGPQFMFNTRIVMPGEVKTFQDFLNPKWKGKIALHDPTVSGTGGKAMAVTGSVLLGWDAIREMVKQEPVIIRDHRLQTEWVAQGKYPLGYGVSLGIFGEFLRAGSALQLGVPPDATYATASGAIVGLMDKAPHPDAARLFINWLLSREGQALVYRKMNLASRRLDVPTEGIDPILQPKPGVKYFNSDSEDWLLRQPEYMSEVRKIFAPLMSR